MVKTTIVRFRMDFAKIPASMQGFAMTSPSEFLEKATYTKQIAQSTGWIGGKEIYRMRPCEMCHDVSWTFAEVYTRDLPKSEILYVFASKGKNCAKMDDLFSQEVAVGDMLVLFQGSHPLVKFGFVCCEGNKWKRVCLMDDNAMLADNDTTPCIGAAYWREAEKEVA